MKEFKKIEFSMFPTYFLEIGNLFLNNGFEFSAVGGCVRDLLLGKNPKDFDGVTNAQSNEILDLVKQLPNWKVKEVGESFAVVHCIAPNGEQYEIASYREDVSGGRDAVISTKNVTMEMDAKRRDFTVNALYCSLLDLTIFDFSTGLEDLKNGILRVNGKPNERFWEDACRMLRAVRFSFKLKFKLCHLLSDYIKKNPRLFDMKGQIPKERIMKELMDTLKFTSIQNLCLLLQDLNLFKEIFGQELDFEIDFIESMDELIAILFSNQNLKMKDFLLKFQLEVQDKRNIEFLINLKSKDETDIFKVMKSFEHVTLSVNQCVQNANMNKDFLGLALNEMRTNGLPFNGLNSQFANLKGKDLGFAIEKKTFDKLWTVFVTNPAYTGVYETLYEF